MKLHHDALALLAGLDPKEVCVVTDPPYGIKVHWRGGDRKRNGKEPAPKDVIGDHNLDLAKAVYLWCKGNKVPLVMFYSPFLPRPGPFRSVLAWAKGAHVGIGGDRKTCWKRDFELVGVAFNGPLTGKRDSAVVNIPALLPPPSGHVAEKPVHLMQYLIRKVVPPGRLVVDPFCGSGTTGVAAAKLGRPFAGAECDPKWRELAERRIAKARPEGGFRL